MLIAITGGTGFIGRYVIKKLIAQGHQVRAWYRESSDRTGFETFVSSIDWRLGTLGDFDDAQNLVAGCDAVVHAALDRPGQGFQSSEGDLIDFCRINILGSLQLIQAAVEADVSRFVFVSSCAVHDRILDDRALDETHPTWSASHYGAYKAAVEQYVYSFGLGKEYPICALRPTGVYGENHPLHRSKWFDLVQRVVRGERVECQGGGKEVHACDVAKAIALLLQAQPNEIQGQVFNCYDCYISRYEVASLTKRISGSEAMIEGGTTSPKHQIETEKLRRLGMTFGGKEQLEATIRNMVEWEQKSRVGHRR